MFPGSNWQFWLLVLFFLLSKPLLFWFDQ